MRFRSTYVDHALIAQAEREIEIGVIGSHNGKSVRAGRAINRAIML